MLRHSATQKHPHPNLLPAYRRRDQIHFFTTNFILHFGHLPGPACTISLCIGHVYRTACVVDGFVEGFVADGVGAAWAGI